MNSLNKWALSAMLLTACITNAQADESASMLSGAQEVPAVTSNANGKSTIIIGADRSVRGSVKTTGITGTAAHIHMGSKDESGPVVIALNGSTAHNKWTVPKGAMLTEEQFAAYKAGKLYVNVHSAAHKDGEIRAQLLPLQ